MEKQQPLVERDMSGETVCGFRVAAYRETHPEHGDTYGHIYSEHWSTPNSRNPKVKVERLFTESQLDEAFATITRLTAERDALRGAVEFAYGHLWMMPDVDRSIAKDDLACTARAILLGAIDKPEGQRRGIETARESYRATLKDSDNG
jgi:hypothetical protein